MTFSLKLFGRVSLESDSGPVTGGASQRHRLALLALLARSPDALSSRDKLTALLWPERDVESARNLLNQCVYVLRKALDEQVLVSTANELRLNVDIIRCDVVQFEQAIAAEDFQQAVRLYSGSFLDGFFLGSAGEFERWADRERKQLSAAYAEALELLAEAAETRGDFHSASGWWKELTIHDPYDSRIALRFMMSLADENPAGALRHAAAHEQLLRDDLGIGAPTEVKEWVEQVRIDSARRVADGDDRRLDASDESTSVVTDTQPGEASTSTDRKKRAPWLGVRTSVLVLCAAVLILGAVILTAIRLQLVTTDEISEEQSRPAIREDAVANAVAREIDRRQRGETASRAEQRTDNIAAYEFYLRGSDPSVLRSDSAAHKGLEYLRQAVALDADYAAAWAGLARMSARVAGGPLGVAPEEDLWSLAEEAAVRAVALDDSLAEAHATLALLRMMAFEFDSAEAHFERAVELDPERARTREWLVTLYLWTERPKAAMAQAWRALEQDPLSPSATAELARALLANGRCDAALSQLDRLAHLKPTLLRVPSIAARCYARKQMWSKAIQVIRRGPAEQGPLVDGLLGYLLARDGRRSEAQEIRDELYDAWLKRGGGAFPIAVICAGLNEIDETFVWLKRSIEDQSLMAGPDHYTIGRPVFDQLRHDPRFERFRERLGLAGA